MSPARIRSASESMASSEPCAWNEGVEVSTVTPSFPSALLRRFTATWSATA